MQVLSVILHTHRELSLGKGGGSQGQPPPCVPLILSDSLDIHLRHVVLKAHSSASRWAVSVHFLTVLLSFFSSSFVLIPAPWIFHSPPPLLFWVFSSFYFTFLSCSFVVSLQNLQQVKQVQALRKLNEQLVAENRALARVVARLTESCSQPCVADS